MMRSWKNKVGYFISSILSWLPSSEPIGEVGGPPSPGEIVRFTVGIMRNPSISSYLKRNFKLPTTVSRSVSIEVEQ